MQSFTCAMCGESAGSGAPQASYTVPKECVELLDDGQDIDPDNVVGGVTIYFCAECREVASRMAVDYDTSPLPECDADVVEFDDVGTLAAIQGRDPDALQQGSGKSEQILEDALVTVRADQQGEADRIPASKVSEAWVIVVSMQELDLVGKL